MRIPIMQSVDATGTMLLLVVGLLLVYFELARPYWILPGAAGAAMVLLAMSRLVTLPVTAPGILLATLGLVLLAAETWFRWPGVPGAAATIVLTFSATRLVDGQPVRWPIALVLFSAWSFLTVVLGSAAIRGYLSKRSL